MGEGFILLLSSYQCELELCQQIPFNIFIFITNKYLFWKKPYGGLLYLRDDT